MNIVITQWRRLTLVAPILTVAALLSTSCHDPFILVEMRPFHFQIYGWDHAECNRIPAGGAAEACFGASNAVLIGDVSETEMELKQIYYGPMVTGFVDDPSDPSATVGAGVWHGEIWIRDADDITVFDGWSGNGTPQDPCRPWGGGRIPFQDAIKFNHTAAIELPAQIPILTQYVEVGYDFLCFGEGCQVVPNCVGNLSVAVDTYFEPVDNVPD